MKVARVLGRVSLVTGVVSTYYSWEKVKEEYREGGWKGINKWDAADFGVGLVESGVSVLAALGIVSNPVGWGVAILSGVYFGVRLAIETERQ